jgi:DNA-binding NarL/FixJ family response regulator
MRSVDPDAALGGWPGLVDGRWSLVDKFDHDGKRFVLARRNEPFVAGLGALTERERAVASYAALGHSNKVIAYHLGIAHSTVRVLLARAAQKLGVKSRSQLVDAVRAAMSGHPHG